MVEIPAIFISKNNGFILCLRYFEANSPAHLPTSYILTKFSTMYYIINIDREGGYYE